jgi:ABC-type amino acid transport substrate-binding protein
MPIGIGIRKGDPAFETALNTALVDIENDGSYAAVFKKWGISFDMLGS